MANGICSICKQEITNAERYVFAITGYEGSRDGGGQNHVQYKQRKPNWIAHQRCLDEAKKGAPLFRVA